MTDPVRPGNIGRRTFLKWVSATSAALSGLLVLVPSVRAFLFPAFRRPVRKTWVKVADADLVDIATPVKAVFVEAENDAWVETRALRQVWLYTEDGENFTCFSGVCTHLGCSFNYDAGKKRYDCPCHHGLFDIKTGAVLGGPPPRPLDTLPVKVEDGEVKVVYKTFRTGIPQKIET